jgi:excisionase family DNA binding protein
MTGEQDAKRREEVRLLDIKQAALFLGTTEKSLYAKIWRREIPFVKLGRSVRFDVRDLEQMIEDAKIKPQELSVGPDTLGKRV